MFNAVRLIGAVCVAASCCSAALAQPSRPLQLVSPFAVGGPVDAVARVLAERISAARGQSVIVLNKPGATGNIGADFVARSNADGGTVLLTPDTVATVNPLLFKSMSFDMDTALRPVAVAGGMSLVMVVAPGVPVHNLGDLVRLAGEQRLQYGSGGTGGPSHLAYEAFADAAGIAMDHVSYKGNAPSVMALLTGEVSTGFVAINNALPHIQAGKLRALAVSTAERSPFLPEVPTVAESGYPGFDIRFNFYAMVPSATSDEVVQDLQSMFDVAMREPQVRERVLALGLDPVYMDTAATAQRMQQDRARWRALVERLDLRLD